MASKPRGLGEPPQIDCAAAATQSGSKSKECFKVMFNNILGSLLSELHPNPEEAQEGC